MSVGEGGEGGRGGVGVGEGGRGGRRGGRGRLPSRSVRSWSVVTSRLRASQAMWASWGETAACGG